MVGGIHGGGILIYVQEDIPSKALNKHVLPDYFEALSIWGTANPRKQKWLLCEPYHPQVKKTKTIFTIWVIWLTHTTEYIINFSYPEILMLKIQNHICHNSCLSRMLWTLWMKKNCFKSQNNPSDIDLFVTNTSNSFQNTSPMTKRMSDFQKMVVIVLKTTFLIKVNQGCNL